MRASPHTYTNDDLQYVIDNYREKGAIYVAKHIGVSRDALLAQVKMWRKRGIIIPSKRSDSVPEGKDLKEYTRMKHAPIKKARQLKTRVIDYSQMIGVHIPEKRMTVYVPRGTDVEEVRARHLAASPLQKCMISR